MTRDTDNSGDNQSTTLNTYETKLQNYIDRTPTEIVGDYKVYIDNALSRINKDAAILEIGTAVGRDADYIEEQGYTVTRSDVVRGFVEYQRKLGHDALTFNVLEDEIKTKFDLIIASAVFLHFNLQQFDKAVRNVKNHVKTAGYFALALKKGEGEEYSSEKMESPRYFRYWQATQLKEALEHNGFSVDTLSDTNPKWVHCLAQRHHD